MQEGGIWSWNEGLLMRPVGGVVQGGVEQTAAALCHFGGPCCGSVRRGFVVDGSAHV
jgi:hypothetical protein